MKVNIERMASPARSMPDDGGGGLPRSTSVKKPSSSALIVNASRQLARASVSTPTTLVFSRQKPPPINCMAATSTDTPPATPMDRQPKPASYYASMWSPRRLMQRASRAFRGAGRSRRKKHMDFAGDSPRSVASKGSDADSVQSLDEQIIHDVHGEVTKQEEHHLEVVPEKIIHEANPPVVNPQPAVAEEAVECTGTPQKGTAAAAAEEVEEEDEPKKGAVPAPAPEDVAAADKFMVAKEAASKKREEEIMEEVVRRFQGSRVKTAMEKRSDEEIPRRREVARSNDVIEEARSKLLEMRVQGGRVKVLVGAFETIMDSGNHRRGAAGKPQLNLRPSTTCMHEHA